VGESELKLPVPAHQALAGKSLKPSTDLTAIDGCPHVAWKHWDGRDELARVLADDSVGPGGLEKHPGTFDVIIASSWRPMALF
jgi:hypothetical protein